MHIKFEHEELISQIVILNQIGLIQSQKVSTRLNHSLNTRILL